jgi:hypothetical protein
VEDDVEIIVTQVVRCKVETLVQVVDVLMLVLVAVAVGMVVVLVVTVIVVTPMVEEEVDQDTMIPVMYHLLL